MKIVGEQMQIKYHQTNNIVTDRQKITHDINLTPVESQQFSINEDC